MCLQVEKGKIVTKEKVDSPYYKPLDMSEFWPNVDMGALEWFQALVILKREKNSKHYPTALQ